MVGILLIAAFFRFVNYPSRWVFLQDQAKELIIARESINQKYLPPLGPKASPGFFAPAAYWYWYVIVTQLLWQSIITPTLGVSLFSLLTVLLIFLIGKKITSDISLAIIAALFAALSPELIRFSITATNPSFIPLLTAAAIYFAIAWIQEKRPLSLFLAAFFASFSFAFHLQGLANILILVLAILLAFPKKLSAWLSILAGLLIPLSPLIFFDLKHNWYNTRNLYGYFFHTQRAYFDKLTWPVYISRFWPEIFASAVGGVLIIGSILFFLSFLYFGFSLLLRKKEQVFISAILIVDFLGLRFYKADKLDSYLVFILPIIILSVSLICWRIFERIRYLGVAIITLLLVLNIQVITEQIARGSSLGKITTAKERIAEMGEKISLYHYPENWSTSLPILVLLEEEKRLDVEGVKIGVCELFPQKVIEQGIRKACPKTEALATIGNIKLYDLREEGLEKTSWQELTWSQIYYDSVFWWKK